LADLVGVSHVTVIAIEKGTGQARLRLQNAWKILTGMGLTMADDMPKTGKPDHDRSI
jgi:DNA-binding XRE family transcriptional regulator